jgi:hypothetical protein
LSLAFGTSIDLWLNLQRNYQQYLTFNSAEAKAIRRIAKPIVNSDWELAFSPGDVINLYDLQKAVNENILKERRGGKMP